MTINRRQLLSTVSIGTLALMSANAFGQDAPISPMEWTDKNGLVKDLAKDTDPLKDELTKYPRCRYCGMMRAKFSHTRMLIVYENDSGRCHLLAALRRHQPRPQHGPRAQGDVRGRRGRGGRYQAADRRRKGPLRHRPEQAGHDDQGQQGGLRRAPRKAEAAAEAEASAKAGAKVVDFDTALKDAYLGMAEDTIMVRKRRSEMRKKNG